jgi:hypothetical protein
MMLFMKTHKCELIVMQIGLTIKMTTNPHQVMFFYWEMSLLARITTKKKKTLLLYCQQKLNIC